MSIKNPYEGEIDIWNNIRLATKQGFDEGVKAAVQYLSEPCDNPKHSDMCECWKHRYLCPDCMAKVHEELGI